LSEMTETGEGLAPADQLSFFGSGEGRMTAATRSSTPQPEQVRAKLTGLLETLKRADALPWADREARLWRTTFPQMTRWLPDDEASALRRDFEREVERLAPSPSTRASVR